MASGEAHATPARQHTEQVTTHRCPIPVGCDLLGVLRGTPRASRNRGSAAGVRALQRAGGRCRRQETLMVRTVLCTLAVGVVAVVGLAGCTASQPTDQP